MNKIIIFSDVRTYKWDMKRHGTLVRFMFEYLGRKKSIYSGFLMCLSVGIILGIIFGLSDSIGDNFLKDGDNLVFDFVRQDVSFWGYFWDKTKNILIAFLLIFLCNLSFYSCFLNFGFLVYQGFILSSTIVSIISNFGVGGVLNSFLIVIPVNIILFACYIFASDVCFSRAYNAKRYRIAFKNSFAFEYKFWRHFFICFSIATGVCLVVSLLLTVVLKSVIFVVF